VIEPRPSARDVVAGRIAAGFDRRADAPLPHFDG